MNMDTDTPGLGHNNPPNTAETLRETLNEKTEQLRARYQELIDASGRIPATCEDDETAGKLGDMVKLITACAKSFETQRTGEKEPYLTLGREVDGFFKKFTENLDTAKRKVVRPLEVYLRRKEDEKRAEARRIAEAQRAESERLAREAQELEQANMTQAAESTIKEAVRSDEQAAKSEKLAEAKPAELARTRGDYGSLATLRTTWVGEIIHRDALSLELLRPHIPLEALQKAVNAFVKAGGRELPGAKIYERSDAQVR